MSRFPALRPGDALPALLALGAAFLAVRGTRGVNGGSVFLSLITPAGAEILDMDRDTVLWIPVRDGTVEVQILDRRARIAQSPCPSGYCVRTGWIESSGQTAVCLPEGVSMEIRGPGVRPDAVSY